MEKTLKIKQNIKENKVRGRPVQNDEVTATVKFGGKRTLEEYAKCAVTELTDFFEK